MYLTVVLDAVFAAVEDAVSGLDRIATAEKANRMDFRQLQELLDTGAEADGGGPFAVIKESSASPATDFSARADSYRLPVTVYLVMPIRGSLTTDTGLWTYIASLDDAVRPALQAIGGPGKMIIDGRITLDTSIENEVNQMILEANRPYYAISWTMEFLTGYQR